MGVCCNYGAPEHLRSVQLQRMGMHDHEDAKINGPSADMWSLGAVMYELVSWPYLSVHAGVDSHLLIGSLACLPRVCL